MTILHETVAAKPDVAEKPAAAGPGGRARWVWFTAALVITVLLLVPVGVVILLSVRPGLNSTNTNAFTLDNFTHVFKDTDTLIWLGNSLSVTLAVVLVSVLVAAPAGYVLSRGRSRAVSGYSLLLFVVQSLPVITSVIPCFSFSPSSTWSTA
jgi:multiple sugar transport system permease protein